MNGGNGDYVEYTYDKLDRVSYKKYNGTNLGFWGYYANGQVGYFYDYASGKIYYYFYDSIGRFINADTYTTTDTDGILSSNMFAYCENNPVMGTDPTGEFLDTVFDVVSLCASVADAIDNPDDPGAWIGVACDVVDLLPFVTGVGETYKLLRNSGKLIKKTKIVDGVRIQKAKDFTAEAKTVVKSLDRSSGYTKSSLSAGREIHKGYKTGLSGIKEYGKVKGIRPDYVDFKKGIIYELKPNNPRSIKSGINQLHKYNNALGGGFTLILELY